MQMLGTIPAMRTAGMGRLPPYTGAAAIGQKQTLSVFFQDRFRAVRTMEKFRIGPGYGAPNALIEFGGDHRAENYPNVSRLLAEALSAVPQKHPVFSAEMMIATDRYFSCWSYKNGIYEIDDDIWTRSITVPDGSPKVIADLEHALTNSGQFVRTDEPI